MVNKISSSFLIFLKAQARATKLSASVVFLTKTNSSARAPIKLTTVPRADSYKALASSDKVCKPRWTLALWFKSKSRIAARTDTGPPPVYPPSPKNKNPTPYLFLLFFFFIIIYFKKTLFKNPVVNRPPPFGRRPPPAHKIKQFGFV